MQRRERRGQTPPAKTQAQKVAKNMTVYAFVMCLVVVGIIFAYTQYKNRQETTAEGTTVSTEVEKLESKDLELNYPGTPAEVMKLYGRINQCMYNTDIEDEDFDKLLTQLRLLYSSTLLGENTFEEQKSNFQDEIQDYSDNKRRIANYTVDKSSSVKYKTVDGQECAYIQVGFFLSETSKYSKTYQNYVLVKEDGKWKILGFKQSAEASGESSTS